ncbi:RNA polymerase sigma-70 factor, ECF subfamily [bacterium A37T11]|nr:RNA polymerase sigma-70 factor, ECF subfamily [bacterium A37T11]
MKPNAFMDEKELLLHLKEGHERAFNQLYQLYSPRIFGNILKLVHNRSLAEDILQEIFLKVWDRRVELDPDKSF